MSTTIREIKVTTFTPYKMFIVQVRDPKGWRNIGKPTNVYDKAAAEAKQLAERYGAEYRVLQCSPESKILESFKRKKPIHEATIGVTRHSKSEE